MHNVMLLTRTCKDNQLKIHQSRAHKKHRMIIIKVLFHSPFAASEWINWCNCVACVESHANGTNLDWISSPGMTLAKNAENLVQRSNSIKYELHFGVVSSKRSEYAVNLKVRDAKHNTFSIWISLKPILVLLSAQELLFDQQFGRIAQLAISIDCSMGFLGFLCATLAHVFRSSCLAAHSNGKQYILVGGIGHQAARSPMLCHFIFIYKVQRKTWQRQTPVTI